MMADINCEIHVRLNRLTLLLLLLLLLLPLLLYLQRPDGTETSLVSDDDQHEL